MSKTDALDLLFGEQISEAAGKRAPQAAKPKLVPLRAREKEPEPTETKLGDIVDLPLDQLVISEQARTDFKESELRELGESIIQQGLIAP